MTQLDSFTPNALQDFSVTADLSVSQDGVLQVNFHVLDPHNLVDLVKPKIPSRNDQISRQDQLWKATCFEMFLSPVNQKNYYEFNFNLDPAWNCYHFVNYRDPQVPQASDDFILQSFVWSENQLSVRIENRSSHTKFNVGLAAVIRDRQNKTQYHALTHVSSKPDFHRRDSFILTRGF